LIPWRGRFRTSWWSTTSAAAGSTAPMYACEYSLHLQFLPRGDLNGWIGGWAGIPLLL
jgi:hypothetical protein